MSKSFKKLLVIGITGTCSAVATAYILRRRRYYLFGDSVSAQQYDSANSEKLKNKLPTREQNIKKLRESTFDVLVIGGGATGAGCALDSVSRGLKTALVEAKDFSSGTSSKSTKLVHGGLMYWSAAAKKFDIHMIYLMLDSLRERRNLMNSAPHLVNSFPFLVPLYSFVDVPIFWVGLKLFDLISGRDGLKNSYGLSRSGTQKLFPTLNVEKLAGSVVFNDALMDDARLNLAIVTTAAKFGATVSNHLTVTQLLKEGNRIKGVKVKDGVTGSEFEILAKCVINATGPFCDTIRKMDDSKNEPIMHPSCGVHICLDKAYCPSNIGLLDVSKQVVIFFFPWKGHTIFGSTSDSCEIKHNLTPTDCEIQTMLEEMRSYLNPSIRIGRKDVLAAWSGIRVLVHDPKSSSHQIMVKHIIDVSESNLITIAGGNWTTYRIMAEETINTAITTCNLTPVTVASETSKILLDGAPNWNPGLRFTLAEKFGLQDEVAEHLSRSYGVNALKVIEIAKSTSVIIGKKLHPDFNYIEAEVRYGCLEYAVSAVDMISRRLRIAHLNAKACLQTLSKIVDIMGEELNWSEGEKVKQHEEAVHYLTDEMGLTFAEVREVAF